MFWRSREETNNRSKKSVQFAEQRTVLGGRRKRRRCKKDPPDGGWSWMVLLGIFVMTTQSLFSVSGLLLGEPIRSWGHDVSAVAAATTTMVAIQNFCGLSSGILIQKWHARTIGAAGTILVFCGLVLTSTATKLWMVFVAWGLMAGIGMGLVVPTAFLILTHYFENYRNYAIGVAVAGTGVGQMLFPLVIHGLITEYQFSGACLITASISLQALPAYLLCRPIKPKPLPIRLKSVSSIDVSMDRKRHPKCKKCRILMKKCYYTAGFAILSDPVIANTIVCSSLVYMTIICFTAVLPLFLKDKGKLNAKLTAQFMTIMSGSDLTARIVLPIVQEKLKISARSVVMVSALVGSLFRSIMVEYPNQSMILTALILGGISRAAIVLNINLSLAEMVGPADLMATIGISMVCKAISTLTVGMFIGYLHDLTKSYHVYLHALTIVVILSFISWTVELVLMRRQNRRNNADDPLRQVHGGFDDSEAQTSIDASKTESPHYGSVLDAVLPDDGVLERRPNRKISTTNQKRKPVRSTKKKKITLDKTRRNVTRRPHAEIVRHISTKATTKHK